MLQEFPDFALAQAVAKMDDRSIGLRPFGKNGWVVVTSRTETGESVIGMNGTEAVLAVGEGIDGWVGP